MTLLKKSWFRFSLVFVMSFVLGLTVFQKELNTNGDNGAFLIYAKALAEGKGFRLTSIPEAPKSEQFPLLFPLILSLFIRLLGFKLLLLKTVMTLFFATSMALFERIASRFVSGFLLLGLVILTATNFWLLDNASIHMSEITYLLITLLGLYSLLRYEESESKWALGVALFFFVALPFVRTAGLAAIAACSVYLVYKKHYRFLALFFALFIVFWIVNRLSMAGTSSYFQTLFLKEPYRPDLGTVSVVEFFGRIVDNARFYSIQTVRMTLLPFLSESEGGLDGGTLAGSLLFLGVLLAYPVSRIKAEGASFLIRIYLLFYLAILATWPPVWSGSRFLVPIIPLLLLIVFQNINYLLDRFLNPSVHERMVKLLLGAAILWSVFNYSAIYKKTHEPLSSDWKAYFKAAEWAKSHLPDNAIVCARSPFLFYLKSDRYCRPIPVTLDRGQAMFKLDSGRVDYVVIDRFKWTGSTQNFVAPLLEVFPARFTSVYQDREAAIYKLNKPSLLGQ